MRSAPGLTLTDLGDALARSWPSWHAAWLRPFSRMLPDAAGCCRMLEVEDRARSHRPLRGRPLSRGRAPGLLASPRCHVGRVFVEVPAARGAMLSFRRVAAAPTHRVSGRG